MLAFPAVLRTACGLRADAVAAASDAALGGGTRPIPAGVSPTAPAAGRALARPSGMGLRPTLPPALRSRKRAGYGKRGGPSADRPSPVLRGQSGRHRVARAGHARGYTEHGIHRIFADCDARNVRSVALLERVGMRREAHHRKSAWWKGEWTDEYVYAVLAGERRDEKRGGH